MPIRCRDDVPGGVFLVGERYGQRAGIAQPREFLPYLKVFRGDLPRGIGVGQQLVDARSLCLGGQVIPQLEDLHAIVRERAFKVPDVLGQCLDALHVRLLACGLFQQVVVPRAEHDAHIALGRQFLPVSPEVGPDLLFGSGVAERQRADVARIHPFIQQADGSAFADADEQS